MKKAMKPAPSPAEIKSRAEERLIRAALRWQKDRCASLANDSYESSLLRAGRAVARLRAKATPRKVE